MRWAGGHMEGPLDGVRVLDLSEYIAGPYCSRVLAGFGADVIKVERPGGDPIRRWGPFAGGEPDVEAGGLHLYLNQGQRSITLDPETEDRRTTLPERPASAAVPPESGP